MRNSVYLMVFSSAGFKPHLVSDGIASLSVFHETLMETGLIIKRCNDIDDSDVVQWGYPGRRLQELIQTYMYLPHCHCIYNFIHVNPCCWKQYTQYTVHMDT